MTPTLTPSDKKLDQVLQSWEGTPHIHGACAKGRGVDCRYLVVGVLDELYKVTAPLPPRVSYQLSENHPREAIRVMKQIIQRYPHQIIRPGQPEYKFEPGDVVLIRQLHHKLARPEHVLIAGAQPNVLWHAVKGPGVCRTGIGPFRAVIMRVYRPLEKERWVK